ncbi:MAG: amidohydrolase family protein [Oleiphilaceae bacterium]|nr:amidohydrolase family protein [Oleiphilaceae bacterium]
MPIFDAHLHIIDPRFPLVPNAGYLPEAFTVGQYRERVRGLAISSGAVVSGSFQAFDQSYLIAALEELGPAYVGVTQMPATASDRQIKELDAQGVRALRFNVRRGGSEDVKELARFAHRVYDLVGWHVELYAGETALSELESVIVDLPAVSVDHLGLNKEGLPRLLRLVERGVRIKATGFGRVDFDPYEAMAQLHAVNPECLMFGTDLPSTRAPVPFNDGDLLGIQQRFSEADLHRILWKNARTFYRLDSH